jgi:diketogulonate reductase-like aldo/keto reductase
MFAISVLLESVISGTLCIGIGCQLQLSLSWLLAQKPFIVPLPGTRSADHLHENLRAIDVQLTPADLREIETALSKIKVHGGRMNEERMMAVDRTE